MLALPPLALYAALVLLPRRIAWGAGGLAGAAIAYLGFGLGDRPPAERGLGHAIETFVVLMMAVTLAAGLVVLALRSFWPGMQVRQTNLSITLAMPVVGAVVVLLLMPALGL